ncbi:hypothetical protein DSO57_1021839 [Entomophthora muscae]|uniref:Uncharacterized protein n=1 Tax=Entomophthora muscae TaxID=34485 RepID=A0ACC2RI26_9FUNG|nr:hypothetical protein DSO57_1021839 [Entomophthora muscae]
MRFSVLLYIASVASATPSAAKIAISNPISGVVWKTGSQAFISWVSTEEKETDNIIITFTLVKGEPTNLQPIEQLGAAPGKQKTLNFTLSSEIEQGTDYSIKYDAGVAGINFSHYFTIDGTAPKPKPTTISDAPSERPSSSSTPTTSAKPKSTSISSSSGIVTANLSLLTFLAYFL